MSEDWSSRIITAKKRMASAEAALVLGLWSQAAIELGLAQYELDRMWDWIEEKKKPEMAIDNLGGQP